ncbi:hypothetical protein ACFLS1_12055, partial [Verrucomicrobiota bacterium]
GITSYCFAGSRIKRRYRLNQTLFSANNRLFHYRRLYSFRQEYTNELEHLQDNKERDNPLSIMRFKPHVQKFFILLIPLIPSKDSSFFYLTFDTTLQLNISLQSKLYLFRLAGL